MNLIQAIQQNHRKRQMAEIRVNVKAMRKSFRTIETQRAQLKEMGINPYGLLGDLDEA